MREFDLHLHEELFLLALRDEKGTLHPGAQAYYPLGAALLAELLLKEHVEIREDGKHALVRGKTQKRIRHDILDACMDQVNKGDKPLTLEKAVYQFAALPNLHHQIAQNLCDQGILRAQREKVLVLFKRTTYPERDGRAEKEIILRLEDAIFKGSGELKPRTAVLIALSHHAGLLKVNLDRERLKRHQKRVEEIIAGNAIGDAAKKAIEAANAAIMMTVIMPAVIS